MICSAVPCRRRPSWRLRAPVARRRADDVAAASPASAKGSQRVRALPLAWISQSYRCIGAENQRKMLCCNNFSLILERPDADRVYGAAV